MDVVKVSSVHMLKQHIWLNWSYSAYNSTRLGPKCHLLCQLLKHFKYGPPLHLSFKECCVWLSNRLKWKQSNETWMNLALSKTSSSGDQLVPRAIHILCIPSAQFSCVPLHLFRHMNQLRSAWSTSMQSEYAKAWVDLASIGSIATSGNYFAPFLRQISLLHNFFFSLC